MAGFFKTFFLGIIITVLLPFIALILAIFFVYCLIVFLYMAIRCIIIFFSGGSPLGDFKEDIEAKDILKKRAAASLQPSYNAPLNNAYPPLTNQNPMEQMQNPYPQGQVYSQQSIENQNTPLNIKNENVSNPEPTLNSTITSTSVAEQESEFFPNKIKDDDLL